MCRGIRNHFRQSGGPVVAVSLLAVPISGIFTLNPPNSLHPNPAEQRVRVSHEHRKVRSCSATKLVAAVSCAAEEDEADAATSVLFRAVPPPKSTVDKIANRLSIELPHGTGRQSISVMLRVAEWRVVWPGSTGARRFKVTGSENLEVKLSTVTGRCEILEEKCVLLPQAQTKTVEIVRQPANRR